MGKMRTPEIHSGRMGFLVLAAALLCPASALSAESAIEEIVVTAQKRAQSIQDVPLSVTAISGDRLDALQRNEIADLAKTLPGLTYKGGATDNGRSLQIRGIGTASFSRGVEQSVGMTIDGVVSPALATNFLDMADVERVEVLRGPQGMLFGKNASAGMVNIVTKAPTEELEWGLRAGFGEENEQKYAGYLSGPLGENVLGRISVSSSTRDGFIENTHPEGNDYNDRDELNLSAKLLFRPIDTLDVLLSYKHFKRGNLNGGAVIPDSLNPPFSLLYPILAAAQGGTLPVEPEADRFFQWRDSEAETEQNIYSVQLDYDIGEYTLTSITSFTNADILGNARGFGIPVDLIPLNLSQGERDQWTQEIRLQSPLDQTVTYVAGLYYYRNELNRTFSRVINLNGFVGLPFNQSLAIEAGLVNESFAGFGQATWHVNDRVRLSLGARYTDEDIAIEQTVGFINPDQVFGLPAIPEARPGMVDESTNESKVSWRIIGEYDAAEDVMLFANVARGYKGPGVNMLSSAPLGDSAIVNPEIPTNYEVGMKSRWLDGRLQLNVSAFLTDFKDFQASQSVIVNLAPVFLLGNAGKLETKGIEAELSATLGENLLVSMSVAQIDATYEDYTGAACYGGQTAAQGCVGNVQDLSGEDLPYSPDLSFSLFARYDLPLDSLPVKAYLQGMYYWQDDTIYLSNNDPGSLVDSYGLLDLALGIESNDGRYAAQFYVKNVTDEFYPTDIVIAGGFGLAHANQLAFNYTRRFGVTLSVNF